jgi:hypothetical protein
LYTSQQAANRSQSTRERCNKLVFQENHLEKIKYKKKMKMKKQENESILENISI